MQEIASEMSESTVPVFVVGSGRNGTRLIYKLMSGDPDIEIHHEYVCTHIQQTAAEYFMGLITHEQIKQRLNELHVAAIHYSSAYTWIDCSNKLSWVIGPLYELLPNAKFVHLTRDGRKVTSSFFHKLSAEIYDDESVGVLSAWINNRSLPKPPPEKKYWWNIPQEGQPFAEEFPNFDQFKRICYHWVEAVRVIREAFEELPPAHHLTVKLEELTKDEALLKTFVEFIGAKYSESYFEFVQRPQNVFFPMDFPLTDEELAIFNDMAGDTMKQLGYLEAEAYKVRY